MLITSKDWFLKNVSVKAKLQRQETIFHAGSLLQTLQRVGQTTARTWAAYSLPHRCSGPPGSFATASAFPSAFAGSWLGNGVAGTWTRAHTMLTCAEAHVAPSLKYKEVTTWVSVITFNRENTTCKTKKVQCICFT